MGTMELFLCIVVVQFIAVQSVMNEQDSLLPPDFPGFFDNVMPFPLRRNFDVTPFDTIFSSWRTRMPDFHMLDTLPPFMNIPNVEVFCDESTLTLMVDKSSNGLILTAEEMQLGNGCFSNREQPNQFIFAYSSDECGTTHVMENGLEVYTNTLHLNLKKTPQTRWQTLSTVHLSCIPRRSSNTGNFFISTALHESSKTFNFKAMNQKWTNTAESNEYRRGQVVNLQVSTNTRPEQQLFVQSCFVSASPEPQTRPRHVVIMNKGCTARLGSPHAVVQFVASYRPDVVNFVLNTSHLISELYIHCSVLVSDQGVTFGSKSCNYNFATTRWEDLSGTAEMCECCSSKCKGLPLKHLQEDAKAVVSIGPLVIVDKDVKTSPESVSESDKDSMQSDSSDGAAAEVVIISGTPASQSQFSPLTQGVVVVSQDPGAGLSLWVPAQAQVVEHSENICTKCDVEVKAGDNLAELQHSTDVTIGDPNQNVLPLLDGWVVYPLLEEAAIAEESQRKMPFGRSGLFGEEAAQVVDIPVPAETTSVPNHNDFKQKRDGLAQRQVDKAVSQDEMKEARPIIRSKVEFSRSVDGSQKLSYEEEVVKQHEGSGVMRRLGMDRVKRDREPKQKGLFSTFLDLLRRMDRAE